MSAFLLVRIKFSLHFHVHLLCQICFSFLKYFSSITATIIQWQMQSNKEKLYSEISLYPKDSHIWSMKFVIAKIWDPKHFE